LKDLSKLRQGFILVTGPTSHGKSTTIAAAIQEINTSRTSNIVTIEDPIEYVFPPGKSIISQREMDLDTLSWNNSLRSALREDPDVVYIGEMRDFDTVSASLTIAETGHLVFSTLHTNSTSQCIDRIIDIFPANQQPQIRMQLSMVLSAVISQRLVPTISGGRIPVVEVMLGSGSVKNTIREGKTHLLDNIIQTSAESGMMLFEDSLKLLVEQNVIAHETALEYAIRPDTYLQLIQR
jgi:twitching motility protein PilT